MSFGTTASSEDEPRKSLPVQEFGASSSAGDSHSVSQDATIAFPNAGDASSGRDKQGQGGASIGRYTIVETLGAGRMGVVYKAYDPFIERHVAVKVLTSDLANNPVALQRFLAEARAAGKLNHPQVVAIHEIGNELDTHFLAMEFSS